jgi:lysophospholipase L1-like esterase
MTRRALRTALGQFLLVTAICLASIEIALRLQQAVGPLYDLEARNVDLDWYSNEVNHKPKPHETFRFAGRQMYGDLDGLSYVVSYDDRGIRQPVTRMTGEDCARQVSLLFLGDSFIMGYDDAHTVPSLVARRLRDSHRVCATAYNAGYTSYAPAIFVPLARRLVPALRPDYVVIDIDETDLVDDAYRYDSLITRNARGENVGVRASPSLYAFSAGLIAMRGHWLYLHRLVDKLWLTLVTVPRLQRERPVSDLFVVSRDRDPRAAQKHADALAIFERNIAELIGVIRRSLPADRIVFISHPHLEHLLPADDPRRWNDIVRSTVARVAKAHGALVFDSTSELARHFGVRPQDYYLNGDMHFNFGGMGQYADSVADFLAQTLH